MAHVQTAQGQAVYATAGFDFGTALEALARLRPGENSFVWEHNGQEYRGMRALATVADGKRGPLTVMVGMDTEIHAHFMHAFRKSLAFYIALAAVASGLFGWWAARRGLAPLRMMASRARGVNAHSACPWMPCQSKWRTWP